jgi:hypothetical protein
MPEGQTAAYLEERVRPGNPGRCTLSHIDRGKRRSTPLIARYREVSVALAGGEDLVKRLERTKQTLRDKRIRGFEN